MPLSPEQKRNLLSVNGYDPDSHDMDEQGNVFKIEQISPAINNTPVSPLSTTFPTPSIPQEQNNEITPLQSFGRSALRNAPVTAAGGLGAATGLGLAEGLGLGTAGTIALPIGLALGASYGFNKLLDKLESEEEIQKDINYQAANPLSSLVGGLVTMPLGGFNPSISTVAKAGGAIPKLVTGLARTPEETQSLINVALGAGIGAAQPTAESLIHGQLPDVKDVLLGAATGGLFNKPNAIGRRMGFNDVIPTKELPTVEDLTTQQNVPQQLSTMSTPESLDLAAQFSASGAPITRGLKGEIGQMKSAGDVMKNYKGDLFPKEAELQRMESEGGPVLKTGIEEPLTIDEQKQIDFILAKRELAAQKVKDDEEAGQIELEKSKQELADTLAKNQVAKQEIRPEPVVTTEIGKEIMPDYTGVTEADNAAVAKESPKDLAMRKAEGFTQDKYQESPAVSTKFSDEMAAKLKDKEVPTMPTSQWTELFKRFGATKRNTEVSEDGSIMNTLTGKPVAGQTTTFKDALAKTLVKINPEKAGIDTAPHELAHAFIDQLRNSNKPADRKLITDFEDTVSADPDYQALAKEKGWSPEEFIATEQGLEYLRRNLKLSEETPIKTWWNDLWSHIKTKYGKNGDATNEDYRRLLQYRFQYDAPFHEYYKTGIKLGTDITSRRSNIDKKNQEETPLKKGGYEKLDYSSEDLAKYKELNAAQKELIDNGKAMSPEHLKLWKEYEDLRNKYGGMPPKNLEESGSVKYQDETPLKLERQSFAPFLTSRIDKITENIKTPTAKMVADNLHKFSKEQDLLTGQFGNKLIGLTKDYDKSSIDRVYRYLYQMDDKGSSVINLSPREQKLADNITNALREPREIQNKLGLKVKSGEVYRVGGMKPEGYMFNELDPNVAHTWAQKPNSQEARSYDKAYVDHLISKGLTEKDAKEALHEYKGALGDNIQRSLEFGALRKAEGKGLPWSLADKNFASAAIRYGRRAGKDLAYFKYIQNDPKMLKALNLRDQFGNLPKDEDAKGIESIGSAHEVQEALRSVFGIDRPRNLTAMAAARTVGNMVMGVGTSARNIANMPSFIAQYVQTKQLPLIAKAITKLNETKVRAFENNAVKASFQDFDAAGFYEGSPNPAIRLMNKFSEFARKYQGRNLSDKFEGEFYYSLGEQLAADNIARAKLGDKEAKRFIERFGSIVEGGSDSLLKKDRVITQDDISRIAKSFVDAVRGTYSEQGLPSWAIEGEFAPFAALSRFSIEKSNTIWKDVILPAKQGIYGPLIRYTLASFGVGALIEQLNELLTNKRGLEATINETLAAGSKEDLLAKAISTLQMASFAGIISDGAKFAMNAAQGKSSKYVQPLSFPLYNFVADTMAGNISDATNAIKQGEDPFEVMAKLATVISTQSVQSLRYVDANFIHPEDTKRKEKFRDFNIWQELTDRKSPEEQTSSNQFANLGSKKFKQTDDISEAASMLPDLISKALDKSGGNVDKLRSELSKIKQNNYQTMPSPDEMPKSFLEYLNYLRTTQGEDAARDRMVDYIRRREINKVKSSAVPNI